jgi:thymidylate synthase (FAD)
MQDAEDSYNSLRKNGWRPEQARSVLPNSTKTEVVMTTNLREWRHVLKMRTSNHAHPQIREVMVPLLKEFQIHLPELFEDIQIPQ